MLKLFQFPSLWQLPNASPFCMKLETYLRMANIPYEVKITVDARKGPKGKIPFILIDDQKMGDTSFIIAYLKNKFGDNLDANLTAEQKALALAFQRLLEEHLYWIMVYSRWLDDRFWPETKEIFFSRLSNFKKMLISYLVRKKLGKQVFAIGITRHEQDEIYQMGCDDVTAVANTLGEKAYFLGEQASSIDATVYAFLANIVYCPLETPLRKHALQYSNLLAYCQRMKERFYG